MKRITTTALLMGLAIMPMFALAEEVAATEEAAAVVAEKPAMVLETEAQKASYAIGMEIGGNLSQIPAELDADALIRGIYDFMRQKDLLLQPEEAESVKQSFFMKMQELEAKKAMEAAEGNVKAGKEFLDANRTKEGVKVTESGLQYLVVQEGTGEKPTIDSVVKVHYTGTLLDGTEFDSSVSRGQPAQFPLNGVISGWTEGLQLMTVGSKYRFFIPSDLAYGDRGSPPRILPNSALIFDVELIEIVK